MPAEKNIKTDFDEVYGRVQKELKDAEELRYIQRRNAGWALEELKLHGNIPLLEPLLNAWREHESKQVHELDLDHDGSYKITFLRSSLSIIFGSQAHNVYSQWENAQPSIDKGQNKSS